MNGGRWIIDTLVGNKLPNLTPHERQNRSLLDTGQHIKNSGYKDLCTDCYQLSEPSRA